MLCKEIQIYMWKGIYYMKSNNYQLDSYLNALGRKKEESNSFIIIWKKEVGHNFPFLFTFKACCKVDLFGVAAAQVVLR